MGILYVNTRKEAERLFPSSIIDDIDILAATMRTQLLLFALPSLCLASTSDQIPFPNSKMSDQPEIQTHNQPSLADLLTIEPSASIFYSYARELELSSQFSATDEGKWTLLVPTNKAVMALSRKP